MKNYKAYPSYKDSEVSCLGTIPAQWENKVLKYVFSENKEKNAGGIEEHILSLSYGKVISKKGKENYGLLPESFDTYQIINPEYLIFRFTDLQNDQKSLRVGYADTRGIITSAYLGLKKRNEEVHTKYFYYLFHSLDTLKYFYGFGGGVRLSLSWDILSKIKYPVPPLPEQTAIANFLDKKTAQIKQFIALKEKTIALLKERKIAIINQAVTKGLDPDVKMKDSGIEWLGEIPEHWEVKKLKYLGSFRNGFAFNSNEFTNNGIRVVKIANVHTMQFKWEEQSFIDKKYFKKLTEARILKGDLVMALTRPIISSGIKAVISDTEEPLLLNQRNATYRSKKIVSQRWIYYTILNPSFVGEFDKSIDKTGQQPNISTSEIANIKMTITSLAEQHKIVEYLDKSMSDIDQSISQSEKEITLMKEYQQSLISEAVTGKIDVREEELVS